MKKTKKLVAILAIASIALSSVVTSFAAEEPVAEPKIYQDLVAKDKTYYGDQSVDCGIYPVIDSVDGLTAEIEESIWKNYRNFRSDFPNFYSEKNAFSLDYKVENFNRYAVVTVNIKYNKSTVTTLPTVDAQYYYIDKETNKTITKDECEAGVLAQEEEVKAYEEAQATTEEEKAEGEEATEEAAAEEGKPVALMQVRSNCDAVGLVLQWDAETNSVLVLREVEGSTDREVAVKYVVGENKYIVNNEEVELEAAPVIQEDNYTYVPVSFFTKILKVEVVEKDGVYTAVTKEVAPESAE